MVLDVQAVMFVGLHPVEQPEPDPHVQDPIDGGRRYGGHHDGTLGRTGFELSAEFGELIVGQVLEHGQGRHAVELLVQSHRVQRPLHQPVPVRGGVVEGVRVEPDTLGDPAAEVGEPGTVGTADVEHPGAGRHVLLGRPESQRLNPFVEYP